MGVDLYPQQWLAWFSDDPDEREGFRAEVRARLVRELSPQSTHSRADFAVITERGVPLERVYPDGRTEPAPGALR